MFIVSVQPEGYRFAIVTDEPVDVSLNFRLIPRIL